MGLFGKSVDWKAALSEQEVSAAISCLEEMVARDKSAAGVQPPEVLRGVWERKTALMILKTKTKISARDIDLICSCLRKEIVYRQQSGQGLEELRELNNRGYAFSTMKP